MRRAWTPDARARLWLHVRPRLRLRVTPSLLLSLLSASLLLLPLGAAGCARPAPPPPYCGDGVWNPERGEQCDDGNLVMGDGCTATCAFEAEPCGDGFCDTALGENCTTCAADCAATPSCAPPCGDGVCDAALGEDCTTCDADCGATPACSAVCGDGSCDTTVGENCTSCPADCSTKPGCLPPGCGNGICEAAAGEDCTSCPPDCSTMPGCTPPPCGNGALDAGETCDGADLAGETCATRGFTGGGTLGCNAACDGFVTSACVPGGPVCGDGSVAATEACDDGGTSAGDGCSDVCTVESGWVCMGAPSVCTMPTGPITPTAPGDLVITEIMRNPAAVTDALGEWFEVYDPTAFDFELMGLLFQDDGTDSFVITTSLVVPAGGYVVLGPNAMSMTNGGVTVDYEYGTAMALGNSGDELEIFSGPTSLDRVAWVTGAGWPATAGAAMSLGAATTDALANDTATNWCNATTPLASGDLGTPGASNPPCP
jgi:cysteine-rich repeat protein